MRSDDNDPVIGIGEAGQTLVMFAIFLTVCLCFVGVVVDSGMYFFERREMQGTADAAVMAAVHELPTNVPAATSYANDYVNTKNSSAHGVIRSLVYSDNNRKVTITVGKTGTSNFGKMLGLSAPEIGAHASARVQMMGPRPGMLPMAFMRDTFTIGTNYEIKFDQNAFGNRGAISPAMQPNCADASGASDFKNLIMGSKYGGVDACSSPIASTIDTEPGQMAGPTMSGFDARIGSNTDSFSTVFGTDPVTGFQTIDTPDSPRLGIVPIIENAADGSNVWPSGQSKPIRILAYMIVYIGEVGAPPTYPAYTNNGKSVWVTPVRPLLPADFTDGDFVDYNDTLPAPVVFRLVD